MASVFESLERTFHPFLTVEVVGCEAGFMLMGMEVSR